MSTAIYMRVSSPKGQKTDSQRAELEAWLKRHHYHLHAGLVPQRPEDR
jgi:DNA invertase Pin-like site-specific DNA recombinase